jgi:hypothetical protein
MKEAIQHLSNRITVRNFSFFDKMQLLCSTGWKKPDYQRGTSE